MRNRPPNVPFQVTVSPKGMVKSPARLEKFSSRIKRIALLSTHADAAVSDAGSRTLHITVVSDDPFNKLPIVSKVSILREYPWALARL